METSVLEYIDLLYEKLGKLAFEEIQYSDYDQMTDWLAEINKQVKKLEKRRSQMGNRVVKFRGKRIDTEDWVTGFYAKSVNDRAYIIVYATEDAVNTRNEIDFLYIKSFPKQSVNLQV